MTIISGFDGPRIEPGTYCRLADSGYICPLNKREGNAMAPPMSLAFEIAVVGGPKVNKGDLLLIESHIQSTLFEGIARWVRSNRYAARVIEAKGKKRAPGLFVIHSGHLIPISPLEALAEIAAK